MLIAMLIEGSAPAAAVGAGRRAGPARGDLCVRSPRSLHDEVIDRDRVIAAQGHCTGALHKGIAQGHCTRALHKGTWAAIDQGLIEQIRSTTTAAAAPPPPPDNPPPVAALATLWVATASAERHDRESHARSTVEAQPKAENGKLFGRTCSSVGCAGLRWLALVGVGWRWLAVTGNGWQWVAVTWRVVRLTAPGRRGRCTSRRVRPG